MIHNSHNPDERVLPPGCPKIPRLRPDGVFRAGVPWPSVTPGRSFPYLSSPLSHVLPQKSPVRKCPIGSVRSSTFSQRLPDPHAPGTLLEDHLPCHERARPSPDRVRDTSHAHRSKKHRKRLPETPRILYSVPPVKSHAESPVPNAQVLTEEAQREALMELHRRAGTE